MAHFYNGVSILGEIFPRTGCQYGVQGGTYPPKKYPIAPPGGLGDKGNRISDHTKTDCCESLGQKNKTLLKQTREKKKKIPVGGQGG